jgi:hypothetical protein
MSLQRDDNDERIARLEKMMEEARAKSTPAAAPEPTEQVVDAPKPSQAKAVIRKSTRRPAGGKKPQ